MEGLRIIFLVFLWGLRAEVDAQDRSIWLENQLTENCANFYDYDYDDDDYDLRIFCFEEGPDGEEIECDDIEADIGEIPWQANLVVKSNRGHFCGGTLLYDRFVLTAAHCFKNYKRPEEILVILGDHNTDNNDDPYETEYDVKKIILHPEYFKGYTGSLYQLHNDIALLQLTEPVRMTKGTKNACLPKEEPTNGAAFNMLISGWGKTPKSLYSDILLRTEVNFIPRKYCEEIFRKPNENTGQTGNITERMICAASPGRDACQGDSGGPLVIKNSKGHIEVVGITSWGFGCASPVYPGVYTNVAKYFDWIKNEIQQNSNYTKEEKNETA